MTRVTLPTRRPNETIELDFEGTAYQVTVGYRFGPRAGDVSPAEVFTHGARVGSAMDAILDDACGALSLLLQHGVKPTALAASMGRAGDGVSPASILGALADLLVERAAALEVAV